MKQNIQQWFSVNFCYRGKTQSQLNELLETRRRSGRKREDKSYVECPDIVIEEDYLSKPSPPKRPNLANSVGGKLGNHVNNSNGIEMESDDDMEEEEEEVEAIMPTLKVSSDYKQQQLGNKRHFLVFLFQQKVQHIIQYTSGNKHFSFKK